MVPHMMVCETDGTTHNSVFVGLFLCVWRTSSTINMSGLVDDVSLGTHERDMYPGHVPVIYGGTCRDHMLGPVMVCENDGPTHYSVAGGLFP